MTTKYIILSGLKSKHQYCLTTEYCKNGRKDDIEKKYSKKGKLKASVQWKNGKKLK